MKVIADCQCMKQRKHEFVTTSSEMLDKKKVEKHICPRVTYKSKQIC